MFRDSDNDNAEVPPQDSEPATKRAKVEWMKPVLMAAHTSQNAHAAQSRDFNPHDPDTWDLKPNSGASELERLVPLLRPHLKANITEKSLRSHLAPYLDDPIPGSFPHYLFKEDKKGVGIDIEALERLDSAIQLYEAQQDTIICNYESGELRKDVGLCDSTRIIEAIEKVTRDIAMASPGSDKSRLPLPCVIGAAGQGKTEILHAIMRDESIQQRMCEVYNEGYNAGTKDVSPKDVVSTILPLFATYNQNSSYNKQYESENIEGSLVSRLLARYFRASFSPTHTRAMRVRLVDAIEALSRRAGDNVLVVLLVDEVRQTEEQRHDLLDCICNALSEFNARPDIHMVPIVTCLDVSSLSSIQSRSQRPLNPIPIFPCPVEDIERMRVRLWDNRGRYLHLCGGHYRSLEGVYFNYNTLHNLCIPEEAIDDTLSLLGEILVAKDNEVWRSESSPFGGSTLWDVVSLNRGVVYKNVDTSRSEVCPSVIPISLMNAAFSKPQSHPILPLFQRLYHLVGETTAHSKEVFKKNWELAVPVAEAIFAELTGQLPPYFDVIQGLQAPRKRDYKTIVKDLDGSEEEQRAQLLQGLRSGDRGIYYPRLVNYPGIELAHTVFRIHLCVQMKMTKGLSISELKIAITNAKAEVDRLGLKDYIIVIYATNTAVEVFRKTLSRMGHDNASIRCSDNTRAYHPDTRTCFVCGETALDVLEPIIGSVAKELLL